ncbi:MAG TPA: phosphotransferase [Candidatus Saccharimonadales bacterium]|nr:phosphotransferase [Candidatus Saccharimonadales bacterium]
MKSTHTLSQLNELFHAYTSEDLAHAERNPAAYANDVYNLVTKGGQKYVMRILKEQRPETVAFEAFMQTKLAAAGIASPHYLQFPGGNFVGEHDGTYFTLSKFIAGHTPTSASLDLVADLGATLANLHDCLAGVQIPPSSMQWLDPKNAQASLDSYHGVYKERLTALIGKHQRLFALQLPRAIIHGDLQLQNVFAANHKVTAVFDLETAENTYRIIDLARTYLSLRMDTSLDPNKLIEHLFAGYDSMARIPLTPEERSNFGLATDYVRGVCATWHALHDTEYTDMYLGLKDAVYA